MKNNKKLVVLAGAAALGLVAATGVTSGFAWFAVNSQVTATGLTVHAKSNAAYLLINKAATAVANQRTVAADTPTDDTVYPVSQATTAMTGTDAGHTAIAIGDWYTATVDSRDVAVPDGKTTHYSSILPVNYGDDGFFLHYDFYLYLEIGSEDLTSATIRVTANTGKAFVKAGVMPTGGTPSVLANGDHADFSGLALKVPPPRDPDASDFLHFEIEMFIEGTDTNVKSATSLATLTSTASFTFDIVA